MYCILCSFSKDRDILVFIVALIRFCCTDTPPQTYRFAFNDSLGEGNVSVSVSDAKPLWTGSRMFCAKKLSQREKNDQERNTDSELCSFLFPLKKHNFQFFSPLLIFEKDGWRANGRAAKKKPESFIHQYNASYWPQKYLLDCACAFVC